MPTSLPDRYRNEFPIKQHCAFFNHAAVCPLPARAAAAVARTVAEQRDIGSTDSQVWMTRLERARRDTATLIGAEPREVAFVKNTTSGLLIAAGGIPWREGDNVVTSAVEFPANVYPWLNLARRGVETRMVQPVEGRILVDDLAAAMDGRTRALTISWVQYMNGFRSDLGTLAQLCRERGAYLVVDAIQGLGAIPLDAPAAGVDLLAADGHKWLLSVEGCGALYVAPGMMADMEPVNVGWMSVQGAGDYARYDLTLREDARRYEEGTHNTIGAHALGASVALLLEAGIERVWEQIEALTQRLVEGLMRAGCEVVSPRGAQERSGIVSFRHPRLAPGDLVGRLWERRIAVCERSGAVRVSPHFYNDEAEIDGLLEVAGGG